MYLLTNLLNYLAIVVSAAGAPGVSVCTVESTATAVESDLTSVDVPLPQDANATIAKIANTFFMFFCLFCLLINRL